MTTIHQTTAPNLGNLGYDNPFYPDNVYGHALTLLTRAQRPTSPDALHLDIGCGYGRIAEPLVDGTGLCYVGVDFDIAGLQSLTNRGFETHRLWLQGEEPTYKTLCEIIAGRKVASITFLDIIEHLSDGDDILRAIGHIASNHSCLVVVSTPNIAHSDVGFKLAFGRWDYTDVGLLDHTHLRLFDNQLFDAALRQAGLHEIDRFDVEARASDQHFPSDHPALAEGTELNSLFSDLRKEVDEFRYTNQFVRSCLPSARMNAPTFTTEREQQRPFLSIVIRTQGQRLHTFNETLLSLVGQTDRDFEVIVLGHRLPDELRLLVERAIDDVPQWLRSKIRLEKVDRGNRTYPLNVGFELARGRYINVLDDDDIAMAHWVETFRKLDQQSPGRVLRAATARQDVVNVKVMDNVALRADGPPRRLYSSTFDFLQHLRSNESPPVSLAFPRGAFHDLKLRFDETLTTTEDWDYLMRVAAITGVASTSEVTSIYRWWTKDANSRTVHPPVEWARNYERILQKMDSMPIIFPRGTAGRLRYLLDIHDGAKVVNAGSAPQKPNDDIDAKYLAVFGVPQAILLALRRIFMRAKSHRELKRYRTELLMIRSCSLFDKNWYLYSNPDVNYYGWDPALHFLSRGAKEGRNPGPNFNTSFYLFEYEDARKGDINPLIHYIQHGHKDNRRTSPLT